MYIHIFKTWGAVGGLHSQIHPVQLWRQNISAESEKMKKAQNYGKDVELVTFINGTRMHANGEGEEKTGAQCIM